MFSTTSPALAPRPSPCFPSSPIRHGSRRIVAQLVTPRFSVFIHTGADGVPAAEVLDTLGPTVEAIFRWTASTQTWDSYFSGVPAFVNSLSTIGRSDVLFIWTSSPTAFSVESADSLGTGSRVVDLVPGFNFVSFTGMSGTDIADILSQSARLTTAFVFDGGSHSWLSYCVGVPDFVNTLKTVDTSTASSFAIRGRRR